jgi:hypothetical protein
MRKTVASFAGLPVNSLSEESTTRKTGFLSALAQIVALTFVFNTYAITDLFATCTGDDSCHACKNCKYCKYCAKDGGKCGVCK